MTVREGEYVRATYDFPGEAASDLSLEVGDVVKVTEVVDANWVRGQKIGGSNSSGTFPQAFVEPLTLPSVRTGQKVFLAIQDFPSEQNGDLELAKGDIILGLEPAGDQWWKGKNGPLKGIFPLTFVAELQLSDGLRSRAASVRTSSFKSRSSSVISYQESVDHGMDGANYGIAKVDNMFVRALVDVKPQLDGELGFQLGDLIEITEILDDDWFYGRCRNKEGLVSAVCVEFISDGTEETTEDIGSSAEVSHSPRTESISHPGTQTESQNSEFQSLEETECRGRNGTSGSYTSENTRSHDAEITPYGRVIYPFAAQVPTELSLSEYQIVTLVKHVDKDWTEGEVDGKKGLFPTSFIEIIVDCPYAYVQNTEESQILEENSLVENECDRVIKNEASESKVKTSTDGKNAEIHAGQENTSLEHKPTVVEENGHSNKTTGITGGIVEVMEVSDGHEIGLVLHSFKAEVSGDISINEGDTVEVIRHMDENWLEIQIENGNIGLVPRNHIEIIGLWPKSRTQSETDSSNESVTSTPVCNPNVTINAIYTFSTACQSTVSKPIEESSSILTTAAQIVEAERHNEKTAAKASIVISQEQSVNKSPVMPASNMAAGKPTLPTKAKPPLRPKPVIGPKPSLTTPKSFYATTQSCSVKKFQHLSFDGEKQHHGLSTLDSLIEGEIIKAKSRSSSQASENQVDGDISSSLPSSTQVIGDQRPRSQSLQVEGTFLASHVQQDRTVSDSQNSPKVSQRFEDTFVSSCQETVVSSTSPSQRITHKSAEQKRHSARKNILNSSVSLPEEQSITRRTDDRRRSDSFAQVKKLDNANSKAFVNKAFQMDLDENLVDLNTDKSQPRLTPPSRAPPPRPISAVPISVNTTQNVSSRPKAPPPRPTGPRIAPAPSKMPLVPEKAECPPKLIPKRPAPRAPHLLSVSAPLSGNETLSSQTQQPALNSVSPPRQHPPRPTSFPTPPKRPPPRPADLIFFSPGEVEDETSKELVADLKTKLEENQADIKKYEATRTDLQKSLSQTDSQEKEAETQDHLDFVDSTLVGLQEEGRKLRENLFALDPHEARLEKARLLAAQHAKDEEVRKEEERKKEVKMKERKRSQRAKVIDEIIETEKDYLLSLQLCLETFLDGQKPPPGIDLDFLLGNMEEIADVSQKILINLETCVYGKTFEEQCVGKCFSHFAEDMKNTYAPYCRNHDEVIMVMERYSGNSEVSEYFASKLEKMREQMNAFDVAGVLIKPVQRILKYPLLLNELLKNTEEDHPDRQEIVSAIKAMTDVAKAINEYKRRKDLVYKYKKSSDQTFSDKISKLNFHSIKKKSSRIRGRLSTNFGIALQMKDESFEKEEVRFRNLEKAVKIFLRSVLQYLDQSQEAMRCQENFVDDIMEFYSGRECVEATKMHEVFTKLLDLFVKMKETMETVVVVPLNTLVSLFNAPSHVIEKRFDKLLDYNYQLGKTDNDKELQTAKNDYEAMNAQLLDELPKFYILAFNLLRHCISAFVLARRDFMDQSLKESCVLLELPSIGSKANVTETFNIRHSTAFDHMSLLSFIPRGFNPRVDTVKADRAKQRAQKTSGEGHSQNTVQASASSNSQSDSQRMYLRQTYPAIKLYTVNTTHNATDLMDISLTEGTMVGVVKELDPMGNKERWFVDDGVAKGFAPSSVLTPLDSSPPCSVGNLMEDEILSLLSYDSGENVVIGNDGRAAYHPGGSPAPDTSQAQPEYQYYYALYNFQSRHENEASLVAGHPVTVLAFNDVDGNPEWWLVDSEGSRGYAPANYMAPMPYS